MKTIRISRHKVYLVVCVVFLIFCAVREVAGTERGEFLVCRVAVKLNPDDIEAHQYLAKHYIERREYTKAAREIDSILRLSPDLDLASVIDIWARLPETTRLAIQVNARTSPAKWN
ncbi:MAG: hypothetical protein GY809_10245 [Planctomycetes bacterium]|nr:hypothetical protein [Planctomycetota bacterium]